jgi:ABC-type Fe3+-hydroxamate transport system substrate-binding protein
VAGAVLVALAGVGCASGDTLPRPVPATTTSTTVADVTVRGVVTAVSASARVVSLAPPVGGIANLALTADTEIVRADGTRAGLADVRAGATVEATGRPSTADTIVARRLVLL